MKRKIWKIPALIFVLGLLASVGACLLTGILKAPTVTEQDFAFSVTYTLDGESQTLDGTYHCEFRWHGGVDPRERQYSGWFEWEDIAIAHGDPILAQKDGLDLCLVLHFSNPYLMGECTDSSHRDPYLAVFDREGAEYDDEAILGKFDAEIIDWDFPEPVKNSFVFDGFSCLHSQSMVAMLLIGLAVIAACIIFVKKDESFSRQPADEVSLVFNFLIGILVIPFLMVVITMARIFTGGNDILYQLDLCLPAFTAFTIAASICLRRKNFAKAGLLIQFIGPALFFLQILTESLLSFF